MVPVLDIRMAPGRGVNICHRTPLGQYEAVLKHVRSSKCEALHDGPQKGGCGLDYNLFNVY